MKLVGLDDVSADTLVQTLGVGQKQLVEIAGALTSEAGLLILDEPTAALTGPETEKLFTQIQRLAAAGTAVIYISHRLEELKQIANRISVLRDGRMVSTHNATDLSSNDIIKLMAGRELSANSFAATKPSRTDIGISVRGLCAGPAVQDVSFEAPKGEILVVGTAVGALNGSVMVRSKLPAFIVTLGMLEIARGSAYLITNSQTQYIGASIEKVSELALLGLSLPFFIAIALVFAAQFVLDRTVFGRYLVATGTNEEAVRLSGVDTRKIRIAVYALSGLLAGLGAIIHTARLGAADPNAGGGLELQAIAAVVVGGTSLMGGRGSVVGTLFGVLIKTESGLQYRYFFPSRLKKWWQGSNCHLAAQATLLRRAAQQLPGIDRARCVNLAYRQIEWILGRNPFGASLMTGVGARNPYPYSAQVGTIVRGVINGVAGNDGDEPILDTRFSMDWRTTEYWGPGLSYLVKAITALEMAG